MEPGPWPPSARRGADHVISVPALLCLDLTPSSLLSALVMQAARYSPAQHRMRPGLGSSSPPPPPSSLATSPRHVPPCSFLRLPLFLILPGLAPMLTPLGLYSTLWSVSPLHMLLAGTLMSSMSEFLQNPPIAVINVCVCVCVCVCARVFSWDTERNFLWAQTLLYCVDRSGPSG